MFNRGESGARDFFGGDVDEFRTPVAFGAASNQSNAANSEILRERAGYPLRDDVFP